MNIFDIQKIVHNYSHRTVLVEQDKIWKDIDYTEKKLHVYLVYDGLGIKEKQLNGSIVLQVGYTFYIEPAITEGTPSVHLSENYHI